MSKKTEKGRKDNQKRKPAEARAERTRNHHTDTAQTLRHRHSGLYAGHTGLRERGLLQKVQIIRPV